MQTVQSIDADAVRAHLDQLTKPPGSLGELERLAVRLCQIQGTLAPTSRPRRLVLFAADHGVVEEGVSAWPSAVTGLMIANILGGGAASNALARSTGTELELVDVGASSPPAGRGNGGVTFIDARIADGTRNLAREDAMDPAQFDRAWEVGAERARVATADGVPLLAAGEMGIGNTTAATCLARLLTDVPAELAVGPGAGIDAAGLELKRRVVEQATARARERLAESPDDPRAAIASVAGFEIAAMAGFYAEAAAAGRAIVLDGVIATAAALVAERLAPGTARSLIAGHLSREPAHPAMLAALELEPFLDWNLRLGEGTGALLLMPLADAAVAMTTEMATFADLGIDAGDAAGE